MAKEYNGMDHTWVQINHPKMPKHQCRTESPVHWEDEAWRGPCPMILHTDTHVWVMSSYAAEGHPEVKRVGDGRNNGYDFHGNCILSVPVAWAEAWYNDKEVEDVFRAMDIDDTLMGYAI